MAERRQTRPHDRGFAAAYGRRWRRLAVRACLFGLVLLCSPRAGFGQAAAAGPRSAVWVGGGIGKSSLPHNSVLIEIEAAAQRGNLILAGRYAAADESRLGSDNRGLRVLMLVGGVARDIGRLQLSAGCGPSLVSGELVDPAIRYPDAEALEAIDNRVGISAEIQAALRVDEVIAFYGAVGGTAFEGHTMRGFSAGVRMGRLR